MGIGVKLDNDGGTFNLNGSILEVNTAGSINGAFNNRNGADFTAGSGATVTVTASLTNEDTGTNFNLSGATLNMDAGNLASTNSEGWTDNSGSNIIFRGSNAQEINFTNDSLTNLEVQGGAEVLLGGDSDNELEVGGVLLIKINGQLGNGDPSVIDDPLEDANEESRTVRFGGDELEVESDQNGNTGFFFANEVVFNAGNNASGDGDSNPVVAEGEIFAKTRLTNDTFVGLKRSLVVNELLQVSGEGDALEITNSEGSLTLNDDVTIGSGGRFTANGRTVFFGGGTFIRDNDGNPDCPTEGTTENGDCTQDIRGSGSYEFGPIEVLGFNNESADTYVRVVGAEGDLEVSNLVIDPDEISTGTSFELDQAAATITGDLENNGTFIAGNQTVSFISGSSQTINSTTDITFFDLTIQNTSSQGVTVANPFNGGVDDGTLVNVDVENVAKIDDGKVILNENTRFNIESQLSLNGGDGSDIAVDATSQNAQVVLRSRENGQQGQVVYAEKTGGGIAGTIDGTVISERRINQGESWYMFANPIPETSYNDFFRDATEDRNRLWIQGPTGSPDANDPNLYFYDETDGSEFVEEGSGTDQSWTMVENAGDDIGRGKGFIIWAFNDEDFDGNNDGFPKVLETEGSPPFDVGDLNFSFDVTYTTTTGDDTDQGWNLVGNPYPTNIRWTQNTGWSENNLDGTAYILSAQQSEGYQTANRSTGDFDVIAPFQGFFVKANGDSPSLSIDDITTVQDAEKEDSFFGVSGPQEDRSFAIGMSMEGAEARAYASFRSDGSTERDRSDGLQLSFGESGDPALRLHTVMEDGTALKINNLPFEMSESVTFPLAAEALGCDGGGPFSGDATISFSDVDNIPDDWSIVVEDTQTGERFDYREQADYTFSLSAETDCSSQSSAQLAESNIKPSPETVRHNSEDGSTPDTRFTLTIDPDVGPLPVELNNFGGQSDGQDALIEWSTASETDNAGFDVEHKAPNAESFERLSFVEGAGTTDEPQSYSFRASDLEAGTHTFRLRQVDLDGDETLSDPIEVEIGLNGEYELSTYPNPVSDQATVQFAVQESQPVTIEVYNTLGQRVRTLLDENVEGDTMREVTLNANDLASGLYIVRMRGESFSTTQKVTVVR